MLMQYNFIRITFTKYFTYFHMKAHRIEMELISHLSQIKKNYMECITLSQTYLHECFLMHTKYFLLCTQSISFDTRNSNK